MDGALFADRLDAGKRLADAYDGPEENVLVLGLARGGLPVAVPLAKNLTSPLDVVTARKLPIPWSPEMGFGAIAPDGSTSINQEVLRSIALSPDEVRRIAAEVLREVHRRERVYREGRRPEPLEGKNVVLVDDGLATGYTMIAAIEMARKADAASLYVAVPVSPADTAQRIEPMVDRLLVLHLSRGYSFAVASFYRDFHDMKDSEVLDALEEARAGAGTGA
ncbi:MAG: phosphoribosyltransferase [Actinobacteria bacterium]|nr:phosphoribosyltransferase [Actinomycetota bacterium]MBU1942486.1 phosphoribosyltransferase [Actinomycetota bacterium]MBU2686361.1 phosphoribosyltransferase [Actinomycetota bacterium]